MTWRFAQNTRVGNIFLNECNHLKENNMFKKLPITDFKKSQIMGFTKWLTELKNRFNL